MVFTMVVELWMFFFCRLVFWMCQSQKKILDLSKFKNETLE